MIVVFVVVVAVLGVLDLCIHRVCAREQNVSRSVITSSARVVPPTGRERPQIVPWVASAASRAEGANPHSATQGASTP